MENEFWESTIEIFKNMKSPLRPHSSEILLWEEVAANLVKSQRISNLQVLILGLTTEIVNLRWPKGTMLTVVDRSQMMIDHFWPGDIPDHRIIIRANWFNMPFIQPSFHLIVGDGVFNFMSYPEGYRSFAGILSGLLQQNGQLCIRIFNQATSKENPADVLAEFRKSQHINYYEFRYRLATSLQEKIEEGICVSKEILDRYMTDNGIPLAELYAKSGNTPPSVTPSASSGKNDDNRISYPTDKEFVDQISNYFRVEKKLHGTHLLSHRTPVFVLSPGVSRFLILNQVNSSEPLDNHIEEDLERRRVLIPKYL